MKLQCCLPISRAGSITTKGAPWAVAKILGHRDATQVLKTYAPTAGLSMEMTGKAGDVFDDAIKTAKAERTQAAS